MVSKATIAIATSNQSSLTSSSSSSNQESPSEVNKDIHKKRNLTDLNSASELIGASSCSLDVGHDTSMSVAETGGCEILADENGDTKGLMQRQGSKHVSYKNDVCMLLGF